ncbi:hypothetical protein H4K35_14410 [Myroides sp. NP-2]|uniref:hypothetical protein n=1 Tax=Myroides sp. NP-2 TaxID=2759945 RepID=UPI0015FD8157|nr:hypothetical protein [Myroides sp. NP-2]MBB1151276.1 hypothetical protein [Myroides sp. NP-2]
MIKKILFFLLSASLFISCSSDSEDVVKPEFDAKDSYLQANLPKILELSHAQINHFKKHMIFDEEGHLKSRDGEFLDNVYPSDEEYKEVLLKIYRDLNMNPAKIIIINEDNKERILHISEGSSPTENKYPTFGKKDEPYIRQVNGAYLNRDGDMCIPQRGSTCYLLVKTSSKTFTSC